MADDAADGTADFVVASTKTRLAESIVRDFISRYSMSGNILTNLKSFRGQVLPQNLVYLRYCHGPKS